MKKIFIGFVALNLIFASCNKEEITNNQENTHSIDRSETIKKIEVLTTEYSSTVISTKADGKWRKILGADLKGFVTGAGSGAVVGAALTPPTGSGALPGAIIGGVLFGAGSSLVASVDEGANNPGNGGGPTGTSGANFNDIVFLNSNNPYDNSGLAHYQIVDEGLFTSNNYFDGSGIINYQAYYDRVFEVLKIRFQNCDGYKNCFSLTDIENKANALSGDNKNMSSFMNNLSKVLPADQEDYLTEDVQDVLKSYFSGFINSNRSDKFSQYSISVENIIVNSSFSSVEKAILLSTMSQARVGHQYWNPND